MEIEYLSEEQLAGRMRATYQRLETENAQLKMQLAALLIVNGPLELPADMHPEFTKGWEIRKKRVRRKVIYSVVLKVPARAVA